MNDTRIGQAASILGLPATPPTVLAGRAAFISGLVIGEGGSQGVRSNRPSTPRGRGRRSDESLLTMATSPTMDEHTAKDAARSRRRASTGAAVLSVVLALLAGVSAASAPGDAQTLLIGACVLGLVGALGCLGVVVANRALASEPAERWPRVIAGGAVVGVLVAWLVTVVVVAIALQSLAWLVGGLGLVVLVMPAVVVAGLTVRGPHPV